MYIIFIFIILSSFNKLIIRYFLFIYFTFFANIFYKNIFINIQKNRSFSIFESNIFFYIHSIFNELKIYKEYNLNTTYNSDIIKGDLKIFEDIKTNEQFLNFMKNKLNFDIICKSDINTNLSYRNHRINNK